MEVCACCHSGPALEVGNAVCRACGLPRESSRSVQLEIEDGVEGIRLRSTLSHVRHFSQLSGEYTPAEVGLGVRSQTC